MKTKLFGVFVITMICLGVGQTRAGFVSPGPAVLSWDDTSDTQDPNTGGTATLAATGFLPGGSILNGAEGSIYYNLSFFSTSDVDPIPPPNNSHGVEVYLIEPGTTNGVSDWGVIQSMTKTPGSVDDCAIYGPNVFLYSISGFFQSDPIEGQPDNGIPKTVPDGFTGIPETGGSQDVTHNFQYQDFSAPPYPVLTVTLPDNLSIFMASGTETGGGNQDGHVPEGGNTLALLGLGGIALALSRNRLGREFWQVS